MFVTNGPLPLLLALFPAHLSTCLHPGLTVMPFPKHSRSRARSPFSQTHPRPSCCRVFAPGVPCATTPPPSFCFPSDFYSWSGAGWDHSDSPALLLSTFLRCWGCAFHRVTHVDLGHSLYSFSLPVLPFISHQLS